VTLKIVEPGVETRDIGFYTDLRWICWIFDLESMNYC